jgi:hypothetical protein
MTTSAATSGLPAEWAIDDQVIRLREWATDTAHPLSEGAGPPLTIGTAKTCSIRVRGSSPRVAREHAHLERSRGRWHIVDLGSRHGLFIDGVRRERAELRPGIEISLGESVTLLAESPRLIALREALVRLLGLGASSRGMVDLTLRKLRAHSTQRPILILGGERNERDLVSIAQELHRLTLTDQRPFVVCHRRGSSTTNPKKHSIWATANGLSALAKADGGTLCLLNGELPRDLIGILVSMLHRERRAQIVLCARDVEDVEFQAPSLVIPPLGARKTELDRLITEYAREAARHLSCTEPIQLSPAERAWIRAAAGDSVSGLQRATFRLVAVRASGSVSAAAERLDMSHVALFRWLNRRGFSKLEQDRPARPRPRPRT